MPRSARKKGTSRFLKQLGETVRTARRERKLLQEQLGARSGVAGSRVGEIERGEVDTSISRVKAIADALEMPLSEFFKRLELASRSDRQLSKDRQVVARRLGQLSAEQLEVVAGVVGLLGRK